MNRRIGETKFTTTAVVPLFLDEVGASSVGDTIDKMLAKEHEAGRDVTSVTLTLDEPMFKQHTISDEEWDTISGIRQGTLSVREMRGNESKPSKHS